MDDLKSHDQTPPPSHATFRRKAPPRARRSWRYILWAILIILAAAAIVWWFSSRTTERVATGRFAGSAAIPVIAAPVETGPIDIVFNALGTVTPLATVTVKTQINGQIMRIDFKEGQRVEKGDLLAEIDTRPYLLQLDQAQGQLLRDQALLKTAQTDLVRYRTLAAQDSIARQQVDTQEQLVRQYEGIVRMDQAQVESAQLNLIYCHISAPVSGRVGLRQVDEGNYASVSDANGIVVITQTQPITVVFSLPEDNLSAVLKRLRESATLQVVALDRGQNTTLATGTLSSVDNQINTTTGTFRLKAQFANDDERLFPNQFVNIRLLVDTQRDATVMPSAAVQRGAPGTYVYAVQQDDTVAVRPVKLGVSQGEKVAVTSGLQPGDRVVVDGADKLRDGAKVTLHDAREEAPAPAPGAGQRQRRGRQG
ncbi:MAG TPA: MdtA/MuxA family multidrug efflux RND transporter periplasmic adaptor subunit [Alphaproteobacteria bacterium]|jgi:multidrug efflux system membrane fusion protein|nr:MdtA/MuxA family multidrug efflux RND transporter periplasmic adaptor subunit [Alphaproteobacteria bacterium]